MKGRWERGGKRGREAERVPGVLKGVRAGRRARIFTLQAPHPNILVSFESSAPV